MKKQLLIVCAIFFWVNAGLLSVADARPIYSLTKINGGIFGYNVSIWESVSINDRLGWNGYCAAPGFKRCKKPIGDGSLVTDTVDDQTIEEMEEFADVEIANGRHTGTQTKMVQVAGENFTRRYLITWSATPVIRRAGEQVGNGQSISINVDREDLEL